jgi:hypothetical protein
MSYPDSCRAGTEISLSCLNDLWTQTRANDNSGCTTSFINETADPNVFTLVGSVPGLLPFSTYGQALPDVYSNLKDLKTYDLLCTASNQDLFNPALTDISDVQTVQLNGLMAQYTQLYKRYTGLMSNPPTTIATNATAALSANTAYQAVQTTYTALTAAEAAAKTTLDNAKAAAPRVPATLAAAQAAFDAAHAATQAYYNGAEYNDAVNSSASTANTAQDAITAYTEMKDAIKADIDTLYGNIMTLSNTITASVASSTTAGTETINRTRIANNVNTLTTKITQMNAAFEDLRSKQDKPLELEGHFEVAETKVSSSFMKHWLYILFALVVGGCLIFIHMSPTEGKLDMFILALGGIILVYYGYDYFKTRV